MTQAEKQLFVATAQCRGTTQTSTFHVWAENMDQAWIKAVQETSDTWSVIEVQ